MPAKGRQDQPTLDVYRLQRIKSVPLSEDGDEHAMRIAFDIIGESEYLEPTLPDDKTEYRFVFVDDTIHVTVENSGPA